MIWINLPWSVILVLLRLSFSSCGQWTRPCLITVSPTCVLAKPITYKTNMEVEAMNIHCHTVTFDHFNLSLLNKSKKCLLFKYCTCRCGKCVIKAATPLLVTAVRSRHSSWSSFRLTSPCSPLSLTWVLLRDSFFNLSGKKGRGFHYNLWYWNNIAQLK